MLLKSEIEKNLSIRNLITPGERVFFTFSDKIPSEVVARSYFEVIRTLI